MKNQKLKRFTTPFVFPSLVVLILSGLSVAENRTVIFVSVVFFLDVIFGILVVLSFRESEDLWKKNISLVEKLKKELADSEKKYGDLSLSIREVFYRTDLVGKITFISPSIEKYIDVPSEKLIGVNVADFYLDKGDRRKMLEVMQAKGSISDYSIRLFGRDRKVVDVSVDAHFLLDVDGKVIGIEGVLCDISEQKKVEDMLKGKIERLESEMQYLRKMISTETQENG